MASTNRQDMVKPEGMSDQDWQGLQDATSSLERIRGDSKEDVKRYLENPDGWSTGEGSPSGLPTLLLTVIGRKSGEKRTTPLVFFQNGEDMLVVGSLAGYDTHPAWVLNINDNPDCWVQCDRRKIPATSRHITDEVHDHCLVGPWTPFVDDRQSRRQPLGESPSHLDRTMAAVRPSLPLDELPPKGYCGWPSSIRQ